MGFNFHFKHHTFHSSYFHLSTLWGIFPLYFPDGIIHLDFTHTVNNRFYQVKRPADILFGPAVQMQIIWLSFKARLSLAPENNTGNG